MTSVEVAPEVVARRPKRADARRNYEACWSGRRRRVRRGRHLGLAGRHRPPRRRSASARSTATSPPGRTSSRPCTSTRSRRCASRPRTSLTSPPWDALVGWLHRFVGYAATKRAIAEQLTADGSDSQIFATCRGAINAAGTPLLERAQQSGDARSDVSFDDVLRLVGGITMMTFVEPGQLRARARDGLRRATRRASCCGTAPGTQHAAPWADGVPAPPGYGAEAAIGQDAPAPPRALSGRRSRGGRG